MNFNKKCDIFAEAKAVLNMKSPLETVESGDIGTFVLAWSGKDATTSVRGTLMGFGCDSEGEYAMVKVWDSGTIIRYTLVAPLPCEMLPTKDKAATIHNIVWRDPEVKAPGVPA